MEDNHAPKRHHEGDNDAPSGKRPQYNVPWAGLQNGLYGGFQEGFSAGLLPDKSAGATVFPNLLLNPATSILQSPSAIMPPLFYSSFEGFSGGIVNQQARVAGEWSEDGTSNGGATFLPLPLQQICFGMVNI
jgi:hypothetical protein